MSLDYPAPEASVVAELAQQIRNFTSEVLLVTDPKAVRLFSDKSTMVLERFADNPRRKRAKVALYDQASFAQYVNAHKVSGSTALFGCVNAGGGSFAGIMDYHESPSPNAQWGEHNVSFALGFTEEWKAWAGQDGRTFAQVELAEFIEDHLVDITEPAAADLLEVVQELIAKKTVNFKSTMRLNNGQTGLLYDETIQTTKREGQIDIPHEFTITIAPFIGSSPVAIKARLRFRINEGVLQFVYKLNQPQKVMLAAFNAARGAIATETGLPVLLGTASITPPPTT